MGTKAADTQHFFDEASHTSRKATGARPRGRSPSGTLLVIPATLPCGYRMTQLLLTSVRPYAPSVLFRAILQEVCDEGGERVQSELVPML